MSNRKKLIITIATIFAFLVVGVLVGVITDRDRVPQRPLSSPAIPKEFKDELPIQSKLKEEDFNFPSSLPLLSISPLEVGKEKAIELSRSLGFQGEPKEIKDFREGAKYLWSNETFYLVVTPKTSTIKYGLNNLITQVPDKKLSDDELVKIAQDFLVDNSIFGKDEIKFTTIKPLKETPESEGFVNTSKEDADIFQVNFTYQVTEYEILTLDPNAPSVFVQIQTDGTVFYSQVVMLGEVKLTEDKRPLKNYREVDGSLNEAILISVVGGYVNLPDLAKEDIKSLEPEKIELAYLQDSPTATILQPVYLLEGAVKISGYPEKVTALLYLPALKGF